MQQSRQPAQPEQSWGHRQRLPFLALSTLASITLRYAGLIYVAPDA